MDEADLATCVSCGLCLPHCPTWRVTGEESASPRGRIEAMRLANADDAPFPPDLSSVLDLCVQCRACEAACPSSVPFGRMMEKALVSLVAEAGYQPWWRRSAYGVLGHHGLLVALSRLAAAGQRLGLLPRRLGLPRLPLRQRALRPSGKDVWLFTGCVMDAWMRPTHAAVKRVMESTGAGVALSPQAASCCGALASHAGLARQARKLARRVVTSMPGDAPVVVDSAGCGAALAGYGELLGTPEAERFAARVVDVHTWLAGRADRLPAPSRREPARVAVQDPCHLRHVQRAHHQVRTVLAPYADLVDLDDEGMCCGAGGAYAALHRQMASEIRSRKLAAIARSGAGVVASSNPGCMLHLRAAGLDVRHPLEIVDACTGGGRGEEGGR